MKIIDTSNDKTVINNVRFARKIEETPRLTSSLSEKIRSRTRYGESLSGGYHSFGIFGRL